MTTNPEHHRRSIRLNGYDYTQLGSYFITICTHHRICLFGEIVTDAMHLNSIGQVAFREMAKLTQRFPNMLIDEAIIMPNHIHAIWQIQESKGTAAQSPNQIPNSSRRVPTEQFGKPVSGSIATMVRSYKSAVALRIHRMRDAPTGPIWQRNYYEHIIRNEAEWQRIREYIQVNPSRWDTDEYRIGA
jgi:REP element-mobilizing transposase RayT